MLPGFDFGRITSSLRQNTWFSSPERKNNCWPIVTGWVFHTQNVAMAMNHLFAVWGDNTAITKMNVRHLFMCMNRCELPGEIAVLIYEHLPWNDGSICKTS